MLIFCLPQKNQFILETDQAAHVAGKRKTNHFLINFMPLCFGNPKSNVMMLYENEFKCSLCQLWRNKTNNKIWFSVWNETKKPINKKKATYSVTAFCFERQQKQKCLIASLKCLQMKYIIHNHIKCVWEVQCRAPFVTPPMCNYHPGKGFLVL